jgi:tetratricopeptide (TPR) repeat protein
MYCPYCGHPNTEEVRACIACGSSLVEEDFAPAPQVAPTWDILGVIPRLVGRRKELESMMSSFEEVTRHRQVAIITVVGEVGLGKSRLVAEFANEVKNTAAVRVLTGRCSDGATAPYQPFTEILRDRFQISDFEDIEATRRALFAGTAELFPEDKGAEIAHLLGHLIGIPSPQNALIAALRASPERLLIRAQSAFKRFLEADANQTPLIICIEDLHHASKESLDLLSYLASNLGSVPILFVVTTEPDLFQLFPDWGKGDFLHRVVELAPLSDGEIAGMLRELLVKVREIPEELIKIACERARGNPFSLVELIWTFLDAGVLDVHTEEWQIDKARLGSLDIPQTVEGVLETRLRRLSEDEKSVLERAAIVGHPFWRDAVLSLMRENVPETAPQKLFGSDELEQHVERQLEALEKKDLIARSSVSSFTGQVEYRLRHVILRELVRGQIPVESARKLHRRAGQWLEIVAAEKRAEYWEAIAEHRELAAEPERAAVAFAKAGEVSQARYAMRTAVSLYERALQILPEDEFAFRLEILHNLGSALSHLGENEKAIGVFDNMLRCAFVLSNRSKAGVALNKIGRARRDQGQYREAIDALNRALALFKAVNDSRGVASALDLIGSVHSRMGNNEAALRHIIDSLELRRSLNDTRSIALSLSDLGNVQQSMGQLDSSEKSHREALDLRREIKDREGIATSLNNLAIVVYARGNNQQATTYLEEALTISQEIGHKSSEVYVRSNLGEILLESRDLDGAEGHLAAAMALLREFKDLRMEAEVSSNLAKVLLARGNISDARNYANHSLEVARSLGSKASMAIALRTLADIAASVEPEHPDYERASTEGREHFDLALEIFEEMGYEIERARTLSQLAEFLLNRQDNENAKKTLLSARDLFKKLGMREEHRRAEEKLSALTD